MRRRENFIWGFLITLAVIIIFYSGFRTYFISKQVREFRREEAKAILGTDPQLLETVNTLERELKERMDYQFNTEKDPLKLSEVIRSPKLLAALGYGETLEGEENMRLNLTVISEKPYASIKYMGKFFNLKVGDSIGEYKVMGIEAKKVVLAKGDKTLVLRNRPDPATIAEQAKLTKSYEQLEMEYGENF